ncbi:hypothetical protein OH77DRAFT_146791 [Trametes cingulata]|nr:hypothetical protein OH77DRAFT_146791 [Trametes cingulata]
MSPPNRYSAWLGSILGPPASPGALRVDRGPPGYISATQQSAVTMPSVTTKNIKFTAQGLGASCKFMLAIVPPGEDTFRTTGMTPVAWKVFSLKDGESYEVTWNDRLAACRAIIDKSTKSGNATVAAVEFRDFQAKKSSDLLLDATQRYPAYRFSDLVPLRNSERARVVNKAGLPVAIGAGFITDDSAGEEQMNVVLASNPVSNRRTVDVDYTPVLKLWANVDYEESQLLNADISRVSTVWEQNLLDVSGSGATVIIARDEKGKITNVIPESGNLPTPEEELEGTDVLAVKYTATLAFSSPMLVMDGLMALTSALGSVGQQSSQVASLFKESSAEAELTLTLGPGFSCKDAQLAVMKALTTIDAVFSKTYIVGHRGAQLLVWEDGLQIWMDINLAADAWELTTFDDGTV